MSGRQAPRRSPLPRSRCAPRPVPPSTRPARPSSRWPRGAPPPQRNGARTAPIRRPGPHDGGMAGAVFALFILPAAIIAFAAFLYLRER